MPAKTTKCVYCHRPLGRRLHATPDHPYVCDLCSEAIRTHVDIVPLARNRKAAGNSPGLQAVTPLAPGERKSQRKRNRKRAVVATALLGMLLPFAGCTLHRTTTLDLDFHPTLLPQPQLPETAVEIPTAKNRPTES